MSTGASPPTVPAAHRRSTHRRGHPSSRPPIGGQDHAGAGDEVAERPAPQGGGADLVLARPQSEAQTGFAQERGGPLAERRAPWFACSNAHYSRVTARETRLRAMRTTRSGANPPTPSPFPGPAAAAEAGDAGDQPPEEPTARAR